MIGATVDQRAGKAMKPSTAVLLLSGLIALLSLVVTAVGLLWRGDGEPFVFTTVRGETVEIYGQGLYRYDSLLTGSGNLGVDVVALFLGVPLLFVVSMLYRRGSLRGGLLLLGVLTYFLYVHSGAALGTRAFNELFFVYVVLFSASLYAFVLTSMSFDMGALSSRFSPTMPRRGAAVFMFVSGVITFVIWAMPVLVAQAQGEPVPGLDHYTTVFTHALDLAVIVPAMFLAGALILGRLAFGYLIAVSLLALEVSLLPLIAAQTVFQLAAGVIIAPDAIVGYIVGFVVLAAVAAYFLVAILRNISEHAHR